MEIVVGGFKVNINLKNGVYAFDSESATGKTFLYKLLTSYKQLNDNVITISYNNVDADIIDMLSGSANKIILADRYDLYCENDLSLALFSAGKSNIVLLDIKEWNRLPICPAMADIELQDGGIYIYA